MVKNSILVVCSAFLITLASFGANKDGVFKDAFADMSGEDQVEFVATLNKSFAASKRTLDEKRIQTLCKVNRDAVRGAPDEDRKKVLAEVFASAPMEALPTIVDTFAAELFHRDNNSYYKTDEEFTEFASAALMRISLRLKALNVDFENPGARSVLAVTMFLKAAGDKLAKDLREPFIVYVLSGTHEAARKEYLPAAMGDKEDQPATMAPITNAGYRAEEPHNKVRLPIGTPELGLWVRSELSVDNNAADNTGPLTLFSDASQFGSLDVTGGGLDAGLSRVPRPNEDSQYYTSRRGKKQHHRDTYDGQSVYGFDF